MRAASVRADGWGWRYATRRAWATRGVTLDIAAGERVLLLGVSGAGKSTLLHGLAGVLGGDDEGEQEGRLLLDGAPPTDRRGRAGLVLQDPDAQAVLARVGDDVAFGCENRGVPREEIWPRVTAALDLAGLRVPLDHPTTALSGGQKQRLALAGALAMRPGLLLLDEPTANLDPDGARDLVDAVGRVLARTASTLLVVEHRVEAWLPIVDRVIVLDAAGGVRADGSPAEVLRAQGDALAAAGVWVPGHPPDFPPPPAAPGEALLGTSALRVGRDAEVAAPDDLSLHAGEVVGITGENGAGKSTLLRTLAGLLAPRAGTVRAADALAGGVGHDPMRWRSRQLLTRIGTVLQSPDHQLLASTVERELQIGPRALRLPEEEIARRTAELLGALRLDHLARANPHTLSGGEKRRLTVAAMLATRPRVCLLDEPTFGQDAATWAELVAIMARLRDGVDAPPVALGVVTHDEAVLAALGARSIRIVPLPRENG